MADLNNTDVPDKDLPLRDDIRLLGRILGDTVREQEGEAVFDVVERIRQTSDPLPSRRGRRRRGASSKRTLNSLSRGQAIQIIRAFSFFSHLANIAEDQHHIRRTRAHALAASAPREGTMAHALARASRRASRAASSRRSSPRRLVGPVLTAHPTEVRRKSTIDREMEVAELLAERDRVALTPEEAALSEEALRRAVLTLWQTNLLRGTRLAVLDEVANGLSYYDYTFLRELPRFYAALEDQLAATDPAWTGPELPSFLRMGSWIGGDRDGNPFVTAEVLRQALRLQSNRALALLPRRAASARRRAVARRAAGRRLRRACGAGRALARPLAAPAQRALPPRHLRHLCAPGGDRLDARSAARRRTTRWARRRPIADVGELVADLAVLHRSLAANGSATLARGRLQTLRRAVDVFGFHLAGLDLRQNSDVHERAVGELLEVACPGTGYAGARRGASASRCC